MANAEGTAAVVELHHEQRLAQRRHPVTDTVGADFAGRLLPLGADLRFRNHLLAERRKAQTHHPAIDLILVALYQAAAVEQQQALRYRSLGQIEEFRQRLRCVAVAVGAMKIDQRLQMHDLKTVLRAHSAQIRADEITQPFDQIQQRKGTFIHV